jgi:predicted nuclease of restriction endonuclease-like (RecB) superfamily
MARAAKKLAKKTTSTALTNYENLFADVARVIEEARRATARSVNAVMTATYWLVGRRIVEQEQGGMVRAGYGEGLLDRLSADLTARFGRGFSVRNLEQMRGFYLRWPISQAASAKSPNASELGQKSQISQAASAKSVEVIQPCFPLPWSHYARLLAVKNELARAFYEDEALRGGWTIRQLDRQIQSQFYERTALSRNKAAMLRKSVVAKTEDLVAPEEEIKEPYVLEFLDLKDEYSETDLEAALIGKLEAFLLELERQMESLLFERLAMNKNPEQVFTLARQGQRISRRRPSVSFYVPDSTLAKWLAVCKSVGDHMRLFSDAW